MSVYDEVLRRAEVVLASGRGVVLDGTFARAEMRARARALARAHGARFLLVTCTAPEAVVAARLAARARGPSESDGRLELVEPLRRRFEPPRELAAGEHLRVDTRAEVTATVAAILARLPEGVAMGAPRPRGVA